MLNYTANKKPARLLMRANQYVIEVCFDMNLTAIHQYFCRRMRRLMCSIEMV